MNFIKRQPPGRLIAAGFALVILAGAALLMLPVSVRDGAQVTPIDALFTSTSAVCVTGLIAIDTADHFTVFGRTIVALLILVIPGKPVDKQAQSAPVTNNCPRRQSCTRRRSRCSCPRWWQSP